MMRMMLSIVTMLLVSSSGFSQVTVAQNPSPVTSFVEASAKLEAGQSVTWFIVPEPSKQVEIDATVYFNGPAGTYSVTALVQTVVNNKVVNKKFNTKVIIGVAPTPIPPTPIDPITPTDAFTTAIQAAFASETAVDKATNVSKMASLYRMAAKNTVTDANIMTVAQLFDTMTTASRALLPATALPAVRKVIGSRLNPAFGASASLDSATRTKLISEFNAIADALSSVK